MKTTINFYNFTTAFYNMNRGNNFSYKGKKALYDYLLELETDMNEDIELDIISLCCEYTEYENLKEFQDDYGKEYENLADIQDATFVIPINSTSFIIQDF